MSRAAERLAPAGGRAESADDRARDLKLLGKLLIGFAVAAAVLATIALGDRAVLASLLRDRAAWGGHPFYMGGLSQIGIIAWAAGASVALFAASAARSGDPTERVRFLRWVGLLTAVLCLDDTFQFHELVAPRYLYTDQKTVLGLYGLSAVAIAVRFRRLLLANPVLPAAAAAALGASVGVDLTEKRWADREAQILVEDGLKQLGILLWAGLLFRQASAAFAERRATVPAAGGLSPAVR